MQYASTRGYHYIEVSVSYSEGRYILLLGARLLIARPNLLEVRFAAAV
jgi:hypothetical protein